MPSSRVQLIKPEDLVIAGGVLGMGVASWLLPPGAWRWLGRMFAPLAVAVSDSRGGSLKHIQELIGDRIEGRSARDIQRESFAVFIEGSMQLLRMYRPGGWRPHIELLGQHHLDAALARGTGAVLWMSWFEAYGLPAKMAFRQAGYEVSHLSHRRHGFGNTAFAIHLLNPICTTVENRYLRERVTRSQSSSLKALRVLGRRLRRNGVVSVTASARSESPVRVPLLAGDIPLAPGAAFLAYSTGSDLLPVHAVQVGRDRFSVTIDRAIQVSRKQPRTEYVLEAARQYASSLEPWVLRYPGQWLAWQEQ